MSMQFPAKLSLDDQIRYYSIKISSVIAFKFSVLCLSFCLSTCLVPNFVCVSGVSLG